MVRPTRSAATKASASIKSGSVAKKTTAKTAPKTTKAKPAKKQPVKKTSKKVASKPAVKTPKATPKVVKAPIKKTVKTTKKATSKTKTSTPTGSSANPAKLSNETRKAEVVFSFDTTGSMYPCLTQVRRKIKECVERLFNEIGPDNLRIGITAHGDYIDKPTSYVTKHLPMTSNVTTIVNFVENVEPTFGGDAPECYELVLHEAQSFAWMDGWSHVLVLIGDDVPHEKNDNARKLDWKEELDKLKSRDIVVHGVQALNRRYASNFYATCAQRTGGCHLPLDQFSSIVDLVMAVCYRESAQNARLEQYEKEVQSQPGRYNRAVRSIFDQMLGRVADASAPPGDMNAVPPGRFQVLDVDEDIPIRDFVNKQGVQFKKGRGFYEFNKPETIQKYKEIIIMDKTSGDMFEGNYARTLLGLPTDSDVKIKPSDHDYIFFVQSTSYNRKLIGGTKFLYEVEDY